MREIRCPVLIGRDEDLRLVEAALAEARDGRGGILTLSGEAGIGKTRLALETERLALESGMRVLRGRAVQAASPVPFRPLAEALQAAFRDEVPPETPELAPFRAALGRLVPEWKGRADVEALAVLPEAVLRLLRVLAREQGLLAVFEDLHWADTDTLAVIEYLADHIGSEPILVLCTERTGSTGAQGDALAGLVARRAAVRISLTRLPEPSVEEMARSSLEVDEVPDAVLEALARRAEGVPFLIEEMLSAYVSMEGSSVRTAAWRISHRIAEGLPASYRELVRERLGHLGDQAAGVVMAAAVVGRTFDWELLSPITGLDHEAVLQAMRQAVAGQLVVAAEDSDGFAFRHALVREALLAELLPPERTDLSLRAAEAMEDFYPGLPGEWCERAADLREQGGDALGAFRLLQESGRRALARSALGSAETALLRARELAGERLPHREGGRGFDLMLLSGVDELLIQTLARAGKRERLMDLAAVVNELVGRYSTLGGGFYPLKRAAELHLVTARAGLASGELDMAREQLKDARRFIEARGNERVRAAADALAAQIAGSARDVEAARGHADSAIEAARRLGLAEPLCEALDARGHAALRVGALEEATAAFEEQAAAADQEGLLPWRLRALVELGTLDRLSSGDTERLEAARHLAVEMGAVSSLARIDLELGGAHLAAVRLEEARECLDRALEAGRRFDLPLLPRVLVETCLLHAVAGRPDEMERAAEEAVAAGDGYPSVEAGTIGNGPAVRAVLREDRPRAIRELQRASALVKEGSDWWFFGLLALLGTVEETDGVHPGWTQDAVGRAYAAYAQAVTMGRAGRAAEARAAFARGDELMAPGWRRHHARRLVAEAAIADGWGEPAAWVSEALAFFEAAGLDRQAAACRGILQRAGVTVRRKGRGDSLVPAELGSLGVTSREMDVLTLVAEGLSNAEVAERLFVSPRTVETHVASLMRKTATEGRAKLVAFAAGHAPA